MDSAQWSDGGHHVFYAKKQTYVQKNHDEDGDDENFSILGAESCHAICCPLAKSQISRQLEMGLDWDISGLS